MANDVIPVDSDKLLFTHDLVNYVFREKMVAHVHHVTSDYREFIYEGFNRTMEDAVEFIEESLELEINSIYDELKRAASINQEAYIEQAEELIEKSFVYGFDAKNFLNVSIRLAMLAEKFYSDGVADAPDLAFKFIHRCFQDFDMMDGGWDCLDLIAKDVQRVSMILPTPSPDSDVEQHFPNPDRRIARQLFRPESPNRNRDDLNRERINELRLQASPGNDRNFVNNFSVGRAVTLENVNESDLQFLPGSSSGNSRIFANRNSSGKEVPSGNVSELDLEFSPASSSGKMVADRISSEKEVFSRNVNKLELEFSPGSSGNERLFSNRGSSEKEVFSRNVNQSELEFLPGISGNKIMLANESSPGKRVPSGNLVELNFKFSPGSSGNRMFANRRSAKEVSLGDLNESDSKLLPGSNGKFPDPSFGKEI